MIILCFLLVCPLKKISTTWTTFPTTQRTCRPGPQDDASQPLSASLVHTSKQRITVNFDCGKLHTGFIFLGGTSWGVTWFIYLGLFQTGARKLQIILFFGHKSSILPGSPGLVPYEDFQTNPNFDWLNPQLLVGEIRLVGCHFNTFRPPAIVGSPLFEPRQSLANWLRFMPRKGKRAVGAKKDETGMPVPMDKEITFSNLFLLFELLEGKPMAWLWWHSGREVA